MKHILLLIAVLLSVNVFAGNDSLRMPGATEKTLQAGDVTVKTVFSEKNSRYADEYLKKSADYILMYEGLIGKFPYKEFTIYEVAEPVGYASEGYTALGSAVIPLPFITETSLGHEILHQWLGVSVDVDYESGNWAEGITTYMADYYYDELKWQGAEYRKNSLITYGAYTDNATDFPLSEFRSRHGREGSVVGYNKSMMFFHMLKRTYGNDKFLTAVRLFVRENTGKKASWNDWKRAFAEVTDKSSDKFFDSWINAKGLPEFSVENLNVKTANGKYITSFNLKRGGGDFISTVPISVKTPTGQQDFILTVDNESKSFEIVTDAEPLSLVVDPYYDVPRVLSDSETPPVLSAYLGDSQKVFVSGDDAFNCLLNVNGQGDVKKVSQKSFRLEDYKDRSVMIAGMPESFLKKYFGNAEAAGNGISVKVYKNPFSKKGVVVVVRGDGKEAEPLCRRLSHYGKYTDLVFVKGKNVKKEIQNTDDGIIYDIKNERFAFRTDSAMTLDEIADAAADARIVYVGESHDNYAHHANQLAIIQLLHKKFGKIAIGMEMFQRPYQKVLDEYIAGVIDERTMLERTEYFKRWKFDYHLYKPILTYARENGIKIIALNAPAEATKKIAMQGLVSLSKDERRYTALDIDYTVQAYKDDLFAIFNMHPTHQDFKNFHEAQLIWDETMAESVANYISNNGGKIVVLAGSGHIRHKYGIPNRVQRRIDLKSITIVQDEPAEKGISDFVLYPDKLEGESSPKLGVGLKTPDSSVEVSEIMADTPAEKAGLKVGDVITKVDFFDIKSLEDLKIALFYIKTGSTVTVKILRDGQEVSVNMEL